MAEDDNISLGPKIMKLFISQIVLILLTLLSWPTLLMNLKCLVYSNVLCEDIWTVLWRWYPLDFCLTFHDHLLCDVILVSRCLTFLTCPVPVATFLAASLSVKMVNFSVEGHNSLRMFWMYFASKDASLNAMYSASIGWFDSSVNFVRTPMDLM